MNIYVEGSFFKHRTIHKRTWKATNGTLHDQIDHICVSKRWMSSLRDVRVYRGADVGSDPQLLTAKIKLKKLYDRKRSRIINSDNLKDTAISVGTKKQVLNIGKDE